MLPIDATVLTELGETIAGLISMVGIAIVWFMAGFMIGTVRDTAFKTRQIKRAHTEGMLKMGVEVDEMMRAHGFTSEETKQ